MPSARYSGMEILAVRLHSGFCDVGNRAVGRGLVDVVHHNGGTDAKEL